MTLGLIGAIVIANGSVLKALAMVLLGLLLGIVGIDLNTGDGRFTFDWPTLMDGIDFVPISVGIFGLGEMIKYGLTYDAAFFGRLERGWRDVLALKPAAVEPAVARCAAWKARAVAADELDRSGVREVLNFGHTVGHALEGATRYGYFRHGEAVLLGMRAAAAISHWRGHLDAQSLERIEGFLSRLPTPPVPRMMTS